MKSRVVKLFTILAAVLFMSITVMELAAEARVGGSRSSGSRGSRSYSRPAAAPTTQAAPGAFQQPAGGGFMRSMAGGLAGGMLGSMLFGGVAGAGSGAAGGTGGGIGMFEIILLAGGGYLLFRFMKRKRVEAPSDTYRR
ncbi:MAG: hypothetical protein ACYDHC_00235 [Desulfuromonadaceae bacterium]